MSIPTFNPRSARFPSLEKINRWVSLLAVVFILALIQGGSALTAGDSSERARAFTRPIEFDYLGWMAGALQLKVDQFALGATNYLTDADRHRTVLEYLRLVTQIQQNEAKLNDIYADPSVKDPQSASADLRKQLADLYARRSLLQPVAEGVLQSQISSVVANLGLTVGGQPLPPVLYHSTPLPLALIISPRNAIRQDEDISLVPEVTVDQQVNLESQVDHSLNVSSLVVEIGGIGVYPTMVQQTSDLNWLSEVVSHEWTHNYLTVRPLGASYEASPELRIMNETTANISGKEIGRLVIQRYYPELVPPPAPTDQAEKPGSQPSAPPVFSFVKEMHTTRVTVDQLLAAGKIDQAEAYMETRRVFFWQHGYHIRKLNQAFFAFYGAYADEPGGGAAGEDPVGAAVRLLRAQSSSLADFLNRISWMSSFDQLRQAVRR